MSRSCRHGALAALGAVLLLLPAQAEPAAAKQARFHYDVPVQQSSPWPEMRRDSRNTGHSPIRARYDGGEPWLVSHRARDLLDPGDRRRRRPSTSARPTTTSTRCAPTGRLRWKLRTGGIIDAAAAIGAYRPPPPDLPDHDRLGRRAPLPPALRRPPPAARQAGDLALPRRPRRRPPGSSSTGGRGTSRSAPTRRSTPATPAAAPTRSTPTAPSAGSIRRGNSVWTTPAFGPGGHHLLGLGRPPRLRPRLRRAAESGAAPSPATSPPRRRSAATAPSTSAPSTASSTRSTPTPAPTAGASPPPSTSTARRRSPRTPQGHTTAIYIGSADGSLYALRPDGSLIWRYDTGDPIRSSPVVGRTPGRRGRDRLRRLLQRQALRDRRRHRQAALVLRHDADARGALRDRNDLNGSPALGAPRHLHRRRARLPRLRPLRLLPAPPRLPLRPPPRPRSSATRSTASSSSPRAGPPSAGPRAGCRRRRCSARG